MTAPRYDFHHIRNGNGILASFGIKHLLKDLSAAEEPLVADDVDAFEVSFWSHGELVGGLLG